MKSLLLIEDDPIMGESLVQRFELEGFRVFWCRRLDEATTHLTLTLAAKPPAAAISDVRLPDGLATHWFIGLPAAIRALPWFFLTGYGSVNDAVTAIRAGAREYLTKPFDIERLVEMVKNTTAHPTPPADGAVLGVSQAMRRVEATVHKVALQKVAVLLGGESGVGKEVAAQLIHALDARASKGEFIAVNCAAIPESMMEAEFFGYEKGAFSGSLRLHRGYLERANAGTLFLDEVGELPPSMQAKLLRALQEQCFFRLGSERITRSDFRVIAATNRDLYAEMNAGRFREDLFYRLAVIRITLPPLRERPEDIRWLTEKLLGEIAIRQGRPLAMSEKFSRDVLGRNWRGNVRELRSYLEQAVVMSEAGILDDPLPDNSGNPDNSDSTNLQPIAGQIPQPLEAIAPLQTMVEEAERVHIRRALTRCQGSVTKTAVLLGVSRKTLWEKMKRLAVSV